MIGKAGNDIALLRNNMPNMPNKANGANGANKTNGANKSNKPNKSYRAPCSAIKNIIESHSPLIAANLPLRHYSAMTPENCGREKHSISSMGLIGTTRGTRVPDHRV